MRTPRLLAALVALALATPVAGCGSDPASPPPAATATVETTTFAPALGIDLNAAGLDADAHRPPLPVAEHTPPGRRPR
jgi:hypothetical protein